MLQAMNLPVGMALQNVASMFSVPMLGGVYKKSVISDAMLQKIVDFFTQGVPVYPDSYEETGGNEIGTQVLIGGVGTDDSNAADMVGALTKVMDNVVVNPRTWKIHGYIGINIESSKVAQVASGMGAIPFLSNFMRVFGRETLNSILKRYIQYISESRKPFKFTTADGDTIPALYKSYTIKSVPENQNWVEVELEIQEFRFVALLDDTHQEIVGGVNGVFGSPAGFAKRLSRSAFKTLAVKMTV